MPVDLIEFNGMLYPKFQSMGNAMQFAKPFAQHICKGIGVDVGCNRLEWLFSGELYASDPEKYSNFSSWKSAASTGTHSYPIDPVINGYDALTFPDGCEELDYIISSHCLEHVNDWVDVLDYWHTELKTGGVLFLYLPDYSQEYWKPWNNRKHKNIFTPEIIEDWMKHRKFTHIFRSGVDLNNSFMIFGEK